jgi:hypothetical protein
MSRKNWRELPRKPRYGVRGTEKLVAEIDRMPDRQPAAVPVELQDLSRDGFQLRSSQPLEIGERVCLRLSIEDSGLAITLPGTVRWLRPADGAWLAGCAADDPLAWESLGELFLGEVLSPNGP